MRRATLAAVGTAALTALVTTPLAANAVPASQRWPSRIVLAEPARLSTASQAIDSAGGADFALAPANGGTTFRLRRTMLATGRVRSARRPWQSSDHGRCRGRRTSSVSSDSRLARTVRWSWASSGKS